jgi:hypothetical protein
MPAAAAACGSSQVKVWLRLALFLIFHPPALSCALLIPINEGRRSARLFKGPVRCTARPRCPSMKAGFQQLPEVAPP